MFWKNKIQVVETKASVSDWQNFGKKFVTSFTNKKQEKSQNLGSIH